MTTEPSDFSAAEDRFGQLVASRLTAGARELPHDIGERLRVSRLQALARHKPAPQLRPGAVLVQPGHSATLGGGWWTRIGAVAPLVALVAGLFIISAVQDDERASELADVDAALLTGDLPPAAYADPGFAQFLRAESSGADR